MTAQNRTMILHNAAGRLVFDAFYSIAEKMIAFGNEATNDFALTNFPDGKTIGKEYSDGQLRRILQTESGAYIAVVYDYTAQTTAAAYLPDWNPKQRMCKRHKETNDNFSNQRGSIAHCVPAF